MPDFEGRNRRKDFRQDVILPMRVEFLSLDEFETEMERSDVHARQAAMLQSLACSDSVADTLGNTYVSSDVAQALELMETKLNYLIGLNMLQKSGSQVELKDWKVNISINGLRFMADKECARGDRLKITLKLPLFPAIELELMAKVVYANTGKNGKCKVGVVFRYRCEEEEILISKYIFKRQRESIRLRYRIPGMGANI